MRIVPIVFLFLILLPSLGAQNISSVHTRWDDTFREWIVYDTDADMEGTINMRWQINNDWSKWDYNFGEEGGTIDQKWRDNPEEWELRGYDDFIYARTVYSRDLTSWRLKGEEITLTFQSQSSFRQNEWRLQTKGYGEFVVHTEFQGDPRDWIVYDDLSEDVSFSMKMAMIFLAIYHGSPHQ